MAHKILVVDDEVNMLQLFQKVLTKEGYAVTTVETAEEALQVIGSTLFDLVISDLALPGINGIELFQAMRKDYSHLPFILITAYGTVESAVKAMKLGVHDYICKPFQMDELKMIIKKVLHQEELHREVTRLRRQIKGEYKFHNIVGRSQQMHSLFELVRRVADSESTILLQGESGTGKELFARAIHYNSSRINNPFVPVDCSVLPETLLESELFGHVKGAFTGATRAKKGLFQEADGGTVFLDEISNLGPSAQTRLLRVLQEREIKPVGSSEQFKVDVRVIAATNTNLKDRIAMNTFREDLYYRIAVIPISIPPLRERKEDIPLLVNYFLEKFCRTNDKKIKKMSNDAMKALIDYSWPGNVRELENLMERLVLVTDDEVIGLPSLPTEISAPHEMVIKSPPEGKPLKEVTLQAARQIEKQAITNALAKANGNRSLAAQLLGISRGTLYNKMREYGLPESQGRVSRRKSAPKKAPLLRTSK